MRGYGKTFSGTRPTGGPYTPGELGLQADTTDEIARLRLELAEARRALEISRSNAAYYKDGVLIAAHDEHGRQIYAHKVIMR